MIPGNLDQLVALACREAGIPIRDAPTLLRHYANAVFLAETSSGPVVARVAYRPGAAQRSKTGVSTAGWLANTGFPATAPVDLLSGASQPIIVVDGTVAVTFWRYYPQSHAQRPTVENLADIAKRLHVLPDPDLPLPIYRPLQSFDRRNLPMSVLGQPAHDWLLNRVDALLGEYDQLEFPLGTGLIHADMYLGNLLVDGEDDRVVLGDWDSVCIGPREIDLAPTYTAARFGLSEWEIDRFADAYGYDLRSWDGWPILREIREISTLSALIKLAPTNPDSARQLRHRLDTLRAANHVALWQAH